MFSTAGGPPWTADRAAAALDRRRKPVKSYLVAAVLFIAFGPAFAINKCTSPTGKVTLQDAPCDGGSRAEEIKVTPPSDASDERWEFSKNKDQMTGKVTCVARSPEAYFFYRPQHGATVSVRVEATPPSTAVLVVSMYDSSPDTFHFDLSGSGIKVDENEFAPMEIKFNSHRLGFRDPAIIALAKQMVNGKEVRLRLRFWPYDRLVDSFRPIPLRGFKQAFNQAVACLN